LLIVVKSVAGVAQKIGMGTLARIPGTIKQHLELMREVQARWRATGATEPLDWAPVLPPVDEIRIVDWALDEHPLDIGFVEVPEPGIVFAVFGDGTADKSPTELLFPVKSQMEQAPTVVRYLASPESKYQPHRNAVTDVFLSYATEDSALAGELRASLEAEGFIVFMAEKSLILASRWEPSIRLALKTSVVATILVTPNSVKKPWVVFEAGAAWGLDIPIAVALAFVGASELPAALPFYQCRRYETEAQRKEFLSELSVVISAAK
jgi:hypothetical protein